MTFTITPTEGLFRGGTQVRLVGASLDVSTCQDSFSNGTIAPLWTDISTVDGDVVERGSEGVLSLTAGPTAASMGAVQSAAQMLDIDAEITLRLTEAVTPPETTIVFGEIALRAAASAARTSIQVARSSNGREVIISVLNSAGSVATASRKTVASGAPLGTTAQLRVLRAGRNVSLFLAGDEVVRFDWVAAAAYLELAVHNDLVIDSVVTSDIFLYERRPVITFGGEPMRDAVRVGTTRVSGSTPEVLCTLDAVDVAATGCSGAPFTLADGFTFTREPDLVRPSGFVVCNDPTLTIRRGR